MKFRGDIQGMRALAVGLVILAHVGFTTVSGGYVGVDVFFVVSGFLIIGLLFREGEQSQRISILDFYARRARRILPAASLVLVVTAVLAAWQWPFVRAAEVVKDAGWAAAFLANFRFAAVETDYFAQGEPPSPMQHYWSLAVEEQFYLVIPLVLLLVTALVRRATGEVPVERLRRVTLVVLGVLSLASLAWSHHATATNEAAAYFSTPARAWELGLGGLLAVLVAGSPTWAHRVRRWHTELLGWGGMALIAWAALRFDAATAFPGLAALVPVLGATAVLAAGSFGAGRTPSLGRLLSLRPFTLVGAWSFSLYLWHWPVTLFARERWGNDLTRPEVLVVLAVTFALSAATYHLVEEPFRRGRVWRPRGRALVLYPASLALVGASAFGGHLHVQAQIDDLADNPAIEVSDYRGADLSDDPAVAVVQASVLAAEERREVPGDLRPSLNEVRTSIAPLGDCDYREGMRQLCPTGDPGADRSIVVMGDSHARAWGPTFTELGERHGYAVYHFVYSGCPANGATRPDPANGGRWTACEEFKAWALGQVAELRPALVVVANNAYLGGDIATAQLPGLAEHLDALRGAAARVALLGNLPVLPRMPGVCLSQHGADLGDCLLTAKKRPGELQAEFGRIADSAGAEYVDVRRWFCVKRKCPSVIGTYVPMRDKDHVTVEYARALAEPVGRALRIGS